MSRRSATCWAPPPYRRCVPLVSSFLLFVSSFPFYNWNRVFPKKKVCSRMTRSSWCSSGWSSSTRATGEFKITCSLTGKWMRFAYHWIAHCLLYWRSVECESIRWSIWPQIWPDGERWRWLTGVFVNLTAERFVQSSRTQKMNCRAFQGLSIGIRWFNSRTLNSSVGIFEYLTDENVEIKIWRKILRVVLPWNSQCFYITLREQLEKNRKIF